MQNQTLEINGLKLSLNIKESAGKPWLFCLHGLQSNKEIFDPLFEQSFTDNYSKIALSFIGFGDSDKPKDFSYDLKSQAQICQALIEKMDLKNIHIIGHSMGGMVGTLLLESIGQRIKSLINLEGNVVLSDCGTSLKVAESSFEEFTKNLYPAIKNSPRRHWIEKIPAQAFYKTSKSIVEWSQSEKLLEIFNAAPQKKLFIYGDQNRHKIEPLNSSVQLAEIPNSGHFMLLDNSEDFYQALQDFLS